MSTGERFGDPVGVGLGVEAGALQTFQFLRLPVVESRKGQHYIRKVSGHCGFPANVEALDSTLLAPDGSDGRPEVWIDARNKSLFQQLLRYAH